MIAAENWDEILPVADLLAIHSREMVRRQGVPTQIAKEGCVDGALGSAWMAEHYTAAEVPGAMPGFVFSCYAMRLLALNHCLVDGNKRLAWIAFVEVLARLGLSLDVTQDEAAEFVERIVTEHMDGPSVVAWAADRLVVLG